MPTADAEVRGYSSAYAQLRSAQKGSKGAPAYSLYINRPLGRVIAAAAFSLGLTPNQVTYLSAGLSLAGIVGLAVAPPSWLVGMLVCLALVLGYAFDSADGQLARLRGGGSMVGEWLDHMIDSAKNICLHLAVLIAAYRFLELPRAALLIPMLFALVSSVHFFGMILVDQLSRAGRDDRGLLAPPINRSGGWRSLAKIPIDYGALCLVFALWGAPSVFFAVYSVFALGATGYLTLVLRKWRSDLAALDHADRAVR
jgi:phosphatidylglycerophosphate synthase